MSEGPDRKDIAPQGKASAAVDAFLRKAAQVSTARANQRGRLIFALDATMSRQPTWDMAMHVQARMFDTTAKLGGLDVQLVYFRGYGECRASSFVAGGEGLARLMGKIRVMGGQTQIAKVLRHARDEAKRAPVGALVYIGDCVEEPADELAHAAGELGLLGVKAFIFHEGRDSAAEMVFRDLARLTGGIYAAFDAGAPERLAALLAAAAAYAAGGRSALANHAGDAGRLLLSQLR